MANRKEKLSLLPISLTLLPSVYLSYFENAFQQYHWLWRPFQYSPYVGFTCKIVLFFRPLKASLVTLSTQLHCNMCFSVTFIIWTIRLLHSYQDNSVCCKLASLLKIRYRVYRRCWAAVLCKFVYVLLHLIRTFYYKSSTNSNLTIHHWLYRRKLKRK